MGFTRQRRKQHSWPANDFVEGRQHHVKLTRQAEGEEVFVPNLEIPPPPTFTDPHACWVRQFRDEPFRAEPRRRPYELGTKGHDVVPHHGAQQLIERCVPRLCATRLLDHLEGAEKAFELSAGLSDHLARAIPCVEHSDDERKHEQFGARIHSRAAGRSLRGRKTVSPLPYPKRIGRKIREAGHESNGVFRYLATHVP